MSDAKRGCCYSSSELGGGYSRLWNHKVNLETASGRQQADITTGVTMGGLRVMNGHGGTWSCGILMQLLGFWTEVCR